TLAALPGGGAGRGGGLPRARRAPSRRGAGDPARAGGGRAAPRRALGDAPGPAPRAAAAAVASLACPHVARRPVRLGVRARARAARRVPLGVRDRRRRDRGDGSRRADPLRGGALARAAGTGADLRDVPGRRLRHERRPGLQPRAGAGHRCGRHEPRDDPADGPRGPARGRAVDGRGRVRLGALAARAARRLDAEPRDARRAGGPRRRRQRARAGLPRPRHARGRGGAARRGAARRGPPRRRAGARRAAGHRGAGPWRHEAPDPEEIGPAWGAAISSFCFFAAGALIPVLPYLLGLTGLTAVLTAAGLVGVALMVTGAIVGVLS